MFPIWHRRSFAAGPGHLAPSLYVLLAGPGHRRRAAEEKRRARRPGLDRRGLAGAHHRLAALLPVRDQPGDAARPEAGPAGQSRDRGPARPGAEPDGRANIRDPGRGGQAPHRRALAAGNRIAILEGGDEAYPAMLEAIARRPPLRGDGVLYFPRRCGRAGIRRRPERRPASAASKFACCWTASASAISFRRSFTG